MAQSDSQGWTFGNSMFWTSSKRNDQYYQPAHNVSYHNNIPTPETPTDPAPPVAIPPSPSFCEHGYPVASPSPEEVPFVTVRKCKKGKNKALKVEIPSPAPTPPPQVFEKRPYINNPQFPPTRLPDRPFPDERKAFTLPRAQPRPAPLVSSHGNVVRHPPRVADYGNRTPSRASTPMSGVSVNGHAGLGQRPLPAGQLNTPGARYQTREWRPSPKKSSTSIRSSLSNASITVTPSTSMTSLAVPVPPVPFNTSTPVISEMKVPEKLENKMDVQEQINSVTVDEAVVLPAVESKPEIVTLPQNQATHQEPVKVPSPKVTHGKPGLIEVPQAMKAEVFGPPQGHQNGQKENKNLSTKSSEKVDLSETEKPKIMPVDDRPQSRQANRKAKKQQNQVKPTKPNVPTTINVSGKKSVEVIAPTTVETNPEPAIDFKKSPERAEEKKAIETPVETFRLPPQKHLLETAWTLYHMNGATRRKGADWNSGIQTVGVFDTVESFFAGFNSTPKTSETAKNQDYMFFRGGKGEEKTTPIIRAAWEDEKNTKGGMWRFSVPMHSRGGGPAKPSETVDFFWKEILMALIGEQFGDHNDFVNGCYFCNRGDEYRLQVWMSCNEPEPVTAVGVRLAEVLELRENIYFDYCSHEEINKKGNRYAKPLHDNHEIFRLISAKLKALKS